MYLRRLSTATSKYNTKFFYSITKKSRLFKMQRALFTSCLRNDDNTNQYDQELNKTPFARRIVKDTERSIVTL